MPYVVQPGMISNRMERRKPYATEEEVPVTRIDSVRNAADITKDSVRHAAEVAAPYASTAKDEATRYAQQAGSYAQQAGALARQTYDAKLAAQVRQAREQAWAAVPPKTAVAVETAARRTRKTARTAADYTAPRVGSAVAATRAVAVPVTNEALLRGAAALHALRGQVTATEIDRLVRRRVRRERAGRAFRGVLLAGIVGGAAFAAWRWWSKQANPDWLVEPTEPTEPDEAADRISGTSTLTVVDPLDGSPASVNGSGGRVDRVDGSPISDGDTEATESDDDPRRDGA
ncbi:conserved hypothetical protein [Actinacidiphila cocklensis]|uniref:Nosiheptide resistance regulatory protein n=1 Tax=Actinacidiphila cocklensis TaxID=887465 RepID=A0A9W4GQG1_9ACTN|nr:conserved hypothetical protein [Actinacidiphila cocklensis]